MIRSKTKPMARRHHRHPPTRGPDPAFWQALLAVHNQYFEDELRHYRNLPPEERCGHISEAFRTLDCWLDVAIDNGWLDDALSS